jgi:transcriptional regulator with XRE-family HTH domain
VILFRNLGRALRLLRQRRGQTQKQAAQIAGITPPMLSAYENDRTHPEIESLDKLLRALDASLSDLDWALRKVSPQQEGSAENRDAAPARQRNELHAETSAVLDDLLGRQDRALQPLPPALREGYAEILHGLARVSRYVVQAVAPPPAPPAPPPEHEADGTRQR